MIADDASGLAGGGSGHVPCAPHEWLFLAEGMCAGAVMPLRRTLENIGLLTANSPGAGTGDRHALRFADSAVDLLVGEAALAAWQGAAAAVAVRSIGTAAITVPEVSGLIALSLHTPSSEIADRHEQLQRAQHLFAVAAIVGEAFAAKRLYWPPAALWSPMSALSDAVAAMEAQRLPPVLHMVAFAAEEKMRADGSAVIRSFGLAHFCDVELSLVHPSALSHADAVRRLARLVVHALVVGPLQPGAAVPGMEQGEMLIVGAPEIGAVPPLVPIRLVTGR